MINAVSSLNESPGAASAAPVRLNGSDESSRRRSQPTQPETGGNEVESAVVAISSEGARRAQSAPVRQSQGQQPAPAPTVAQGSPEKDAAPISLPAGSPDSSQAAPAVAAEADASKAVSSKTQADQDLSAPKYDEADANQDGAVDVMERKIYDFNYPTLDGKKSAQPDAAAESARRQNLAELKAYEDVARSGRSY